MSFFLLEALWFWSILWFSHGSCLADTYEGTGAVKSVNVHFLVVTYHKTSVICTGWTWPSIVHVHVSASRAVLVTGGHVLYVDMCVNTARKTNVGASYWSGYWCECAGSWCMQRWVCVQCVYSCMCVFVYVWGQIAWHGDEIDTLTVSEVGRVSKFNILLISSPEKRERERQIETDINPK